MLTVQVTARCHQKHCDNVINHAVGGYMQMYRMDKCDMVHAWESVVSWAPGGTVS